MTQTYLQLRHAADELIGHLHIRAVGIVEGDKLGGQVLVAIEEPSVGREIPGRAGRWERGDLSLFSHSCSYSLHTEGYWVPKSHQSQAQPSGTQSNTQAPLSPWEQRQGRETVPELGETRLGEASQGG